MRLLTSEDIRRYSSVIFALLAAVALAQIITQQPIGLVANYFGKDTAQSSFWGSQFRISATFTSPNLFAIVFQFFSSLLFARYLYVPSVRSLPKALLLVLLTSFIIFTSLSRSGMLFSVVLFLLQYALWLRDDHEVRNKWVANAVLVFFALLFLFGLGNFVVEFVGNGIDRLSNLSDSNRVTLAVGALGLLGRI